VHAQALSTRPRGVILTSDGVHGMPAEVFRWAVHSSSHLQALADRLVQLSDWDGGTDNASAICIGLQNGGEHRGGQVECWVPGDHIVFVEGQSRSWPRPEPPPIAPPGPGQPGERRSEEPDLKKKGPREKKAAKRSRRSSTRAEPPAHQAQTLPIEVTFESSDGTDTEQQEVPKGSKSSGSED
jgi:hypothetical protein